MKPADALVLAEHLRALDVEWVVPRRVVAAGPAPAEPVGVALVYATAELWRWAGDVLTNLELVAPHAIAATGASDEDYQGAQDAHPLGIVRTVWIGANGQREERIAMKDYRIAAHWILDAQLHLSSEFASCAGRRARHPWAVWDAYVGSRLRFALVPLRDEEREAQRRKLLDTLAVPARMLASHRAASRAIRAVAGWLADKGDELDAVIALADAYSAWTAADVEPDTIRASLRRARERRALGRRSHDARRLVARELGIAEKTLAKIAARAGGNLVAFGG